MRIHLIAIGGAIMHNLAIDLYNNGHIVSGSDDEIYDPASSKLKKCGLLPENMGWNPDLITPDLDLVILGMHARSDNPELLKAQNIGVKVVSFPEFIYEKSKDKTRIVVAGSHGKTSTTAMIMSCLRKTGLDFDYLVGAQLEGFETMVRLSDAPIIVIEGDEYLSSTIDMRPKFMHYQPQILIITGIAWDHMNVFPTKQNYIDQFRSLLQTTADDSHIIYYNGDSDLRALMGESTYKNAVSYESLAYSNVDGHQQQVIYNGLNYPVKVFGRHNFENMHAAMMACQLVGVQPTDFFKHIATFTGAAKRLELLVENENYIVLRDFAHAPSKVLATTKAVKESFLGKKLIAVVELHTFSSLNVNFHPEYANTLIDADDALVFYSPHTLKMKKLPHFSKEELQNAFESDNVVVYDNKEDLWHAFFKKVEKDSVFLFMSSGTYEGTDMDWVLNKIESMIGPK